MKRKITFIIITVMVLVILIAGAFLVFKQNSDGFNTAHGFNLLVITLDTTRADRIGVYGCSGARTPNLDLLAEHGVLFENCYASVPLTLPSHSSLFTGKYSIGHGVRNNGSYLLPEMELTLAEVMKSKGFVTYAKVSAYVLHAKFGLDQGFDLYDDSLDIEKMAYGFESEIPAEQVYKKYKQWFSQHNKEKPFFAWVHFFDPHLPYNAPPEFAQRFDDKKWGPYDSELAYMDNYIGKIIQDLKNAGIWEKTLVVVVGDHGEAMGEHQEEGHGIFCYDESIKVPLIISNPQLLPAKKRIKNSANIVDVMPTLLELYGEKVNPEIQGESLLYDLFNDEEKGYARTFYLESMYGGEEYGWAPLTGIIHGNYKYISLPKAELYDLETDKTEKENLFFKKNTLARQLDKKLRETIRLYSSTSGSSARKMSAEDQAHLKSLGYISSFSVKGSKAFDPKTGIKIKNRFAVIQEQIDRGETNQAWTQLNQIAADNPEMKIPTYYTLMLHILHARKDQAGQLALMQEAVRKFPDNHLLKLQQATFFFENQGNPAEAEAVCLNILQADPQFTRAMILLSRIHSSRKNITQAIDHINQAIKIEPGNILLQIRLCRLLKQAGKFRKVASICTDLLEREEVKHSNNLMLRIAILFTEMGQGKRAFPVLSAIIKRDDGNGEAWNYLGIIYSRRNQLTRAEEAYKKSIGLLPRVAITYNNLGTLYLTRFVKERETRFHALALNEFNEALKLNPSLVSALNGRASAYKFVNRVADALADWKKAITMKPDFSDAYFNIAVTYLQIKNKTQALIYLNLCKERLYKQLPPRKQTRLDRLITQASS